MDCLAKACQELKKDGIEVALIATHENVAYTSGFATPLPITYPTETPLAFPLSMVLVDVGKAEGTLIAVESLRDLAVQQCRLSNRQFLPGGAELESPAAGSSYRAALSRSFAGSGAARRLGVESKALPLTVRDWLPEALGRAEIVDATPALERARMTKDAEEMEALRKAALLGDAAQNALVNAARSHGRNEFEVWTEILQAVYRAAGEVVPVFGELVTGPRTNEVHYPGGPRDRVIQRGDTGILDISMRLDGYWSDCCNTVVFGDAPRADQRKYMEAAKDCLSAALDVLRPGARCRDVADAIEKTHARHGVSSPRFYGHQVGVTVNEHPRLIPTDETIIQTGMVFCIEPGAYAGASGSTGARVEKMVIVTESGPEVVHRFPWGL